MNGFQYFPFQVILFSPKDLCFFKFEILPRWSVMERNPTILHIIRLKIREVPFAWILVLLNSFSELSFGVTNILEFLVIGRYFYLYSTYILLSLQNILQKSSKNYDTIARFSLLCSYRKFSLLNLCNLHRIIATCCDKFSLHSQNCS